jgi:DNA repair exonuclease SbcCD ATPase subunit
MSAPIHNVRDGVIPAIVPSAPITEAHRKLACDVLLDHSVSGAATKDGVIAAAQWIADSEAAAVQTAMLREYGNLCATNEGLAKERDQLRAEIARIDSEKPWLKEANATNADLRAETQRLKFYIATTIQPDEYAKVIKDLRAEVERLKRDYEYDHKCLHEVRERCELWKQRAERAEAAMERLSEWQAGVIENARAHHAQLKDAIARAERAEAELATERARLDWLEKRGPWESWNGFGETGITLRENIRAAIDAAMKEGAK